MKRGDDTNDIINSLCDKIADLTSRLTAALRFVPTIESAEAILADEDAPEEFRGEAELVKWLRGKE